MDNKSSKRSSNIDLLRIVSMLLIIWLHSIDHSGVLEEADAVGGIMSVYVRFTYMLVQVCVNCYVLISGYFLVTSKFRIQKLVALWMEVVFYSVMIKLVFMGIGYTPFSLFSLISCIVPVFTGRYWFITIYFGLYIISPFLNIAIHAMNREQHLKLNIELFFLFSVMISVSPVFKGMNSGEGWGLAWFVVLYFLASWFRLYYNSNGKWKVKILGWAGIAVIVTLIYEIGGRLSPARIIASNWYRYDSVPAYMMSLILFVAFLNIQISSERISRAIAVVAPSTLGVYLIHAHASLSPWSWEVLNLPKKMQSPLFPLIQLLAVVGIFIGCSCIDLVCKYTIGKMEKGSRVVYISNMISDTISLLVCRKKDDE